MIPEKTKQKQPRKTKRKTAKAPPVSQDKPPSWAAAEIHAMMAELDPPEPETEGEAWFLYLNPDAPRSVYEIDPQFPMSVADLEKKEHE